MRETWTVVGRGRDWDLVWRVVVEGSTFCAVWYCFCLTGEVKGGSLLLDIVHLVNIVAILSSFEMYSPLFVNYFPPIICSIDIYFGYSSAFFFSMTSLLTVSKKFRRSCSFWTDGGTFSLSLARRAASLTWYSWNCLMRILCSGYASTLYSLSPILNKLSL